MDFGEKRKNRQISEREVAQKSVFCYNKIQIPKNEIVQLKGEVP